jgi:acetoacetyl-CoA synthase
VSEQSVGILATGSYVPRTVVGNAGLEESLGVAEGWIERKTHIRTRRYAAPAEATSDLAAHAATGALASAGMTADDVDYLIVSTSTGDHPQPPTASLVQDAIGARAAACFDINVVCSGFVYALAVARGLVALQPGARALVIGADVYSRILDFEDRRTAVLFGDGAGAAVVGAVPQPYGLIGFELCGRGDAHQLLGVPAGGSRHPASAQTVASGAHLFQMRGREVRDFVAEEVPPAVDRLLRRAGVDAGAVHHFVPHQANGVMIDELAKSTGLTAATTHRTVERYGNTGSASVVVTLDEANSAGSLRDGDVVVLAGFGGGMAVGACLLRWHAPARV